MLDMISIFLNLLRLDLWPKMWSILENVPCALFFCIGMSWRYPWDPSHLMHHLRLAFPYFLFWWSVHWCEWGVKVFYYYCVTVISPFMSVSVFLIYWGAPMLCISSFQLLSHVRLFATPWTAARQASPSITNSQSLPKLMSIESVMPSNHLILCRLHLLQPSIFQCCA